MGKPTKIAWPITPFRSAAVVMWPGATFEPRLQDDVLGPLAEDTMMLLTRVVSDRVRKCEGCPVHFLDVSKKGSRRWCSMALCGNKVKVAAYQQRQREE